MFTQYAFSRPRSSFSVTAFCISVLSVDTYSITAFLYSFHSNGSFDDNGSVILIIGTIVQIPVRNQTLNLILTLTLLLNSTQ